MSVAGKRRMPSVVKAAIKAKGELEPITVMTYERDAACILESLVAQYSEQEVLTALKAQGFDAPAYRSLLRALAKLAKARRPERLAGAQ